MNVHSPPQTPRVLVVQMGARHQYAVPSALENHDMLEALYTDLYATGGMGRVAAPLSRWTGAKGARLARRLPPPDVSKRAKGFVGWAADFAWATRRASSSEDRARRIARVHQRASTAMVEAGFGRATHALAMFLEGPALLARAKDKGLTTLTDMNIALSAERITREERWRFPEWEEDGYFWGETLTDSDPTFRPSAETLAHTDYFLCPSHFVQEDLIRTHSIDRRRTRLLPYAVHDDFLSLKPAPQPGRILFVGTFCLRKGAHILAEAAQILTGRGRRYSFNIAGAATKRVRSLPATRELTFLGHLDRQALREEFRRADILVLPSLAEGSAGVTYEALGAGVPVIATREAGSIVESGLHGEIVPSRDPQALADAIEAIAEDRPRRDALSAAARDKASAHDWPSYADRLAAIILETSPTLMGRR